MSKSCVNTLFQSKKYLKNINHLQALLIIFVVAFISYLLFYVPQLSSDDWSLIVGNFVFKSLHAIDFSDRRPFIGLYYFLLTEIFGLNIQVFYVSNIIILVINAYLIYVIIYNQIRSISWIALPVALLFLIYPVDYTRMWLIGANVRINMTLALISMLFLLTYYKNGGIWKLFIAVIILLVSLLIYEAQLGIYFGWIFLLLISYHSTSKSRYWALISLFSLLPLFAFWRIFGQQQLFRINDPYVDNINFNFITIANRFYHNLQIYFISWVQPFALHYKLSNTRLLLLLVSLFFLIGIIGLLYLKKKNSTSGDFCYPNQIKTLFWSALSGAFLWIVGYIPVIFIYEPSLNFSTSRINYFSVPGAALFIVSVLGLFFMLILKSQKNTKILIWVFLLPFLGIGIFTQNWVEYSSKMDWNEQKLIWKEIFKLAPDFKDNTTAIIVMNSYYTQEIFRHAPLTADWEANSGLEVLYNNQSLMGKLYFLDNSYACSVQLSKNGVVPPWTKKIIPYNNTVFFYYDNETGYLHIIENLSTELNLPFSNPYNYDPKERILPQLSKDSSKYRYLIQ